MFDLLKILKLDSLFNNLIGFIETKIEFYKLQLKEEAARTLALLLFLYFISLAGLLFLIFLSFFFVALLNHFFESQYLGFLIMALFYLVSGIILYIFRKEIFLKRTFSHFLPEEGKKSEAEPIKE